MDRNRYNRRPYREEEEGEGGGSELFAAAVIGTPFVPGYGMGMDDSPSNSQPYEIHDTSSSVSENEESCSISNVSENETLSSPHDIAEIV